MVVVLFKNHIARNIKPITELRFLIIARKIMTSFFLQFKTPRPGKGFNRVLL